MSFNLVVPREYGYVVLTTASTFIFGMWHGVRTTGFRTSAGIRYPKAYADSSDMSAADAEKKKKMYLFNCAQRAHSNYLENHASVAMAMLISGVQYPLVTTALGVAWSAFRLAYALGYTRANQEHGKGRMVGLGFWPAQLGLYGLAAWCGIKMLL